MQYMWEWVKSVYRCTHAKKEGGDGVKWQEEIARESVCTVAWYTRKHDPRDGGEGGERTNGTHADS